MLPNNKDDLIFWPRSLSRLQASLYCLLPNKYSKVLHSPFFLILFHSTSARSGPITIHSTSFFVCHTTNVSEKSASTSYHNIMPQNTSQITNGIQEFYAPHIQELIQQTPPQRPVQLSDITEHSRAEEERAPGGLGSYKAGGEFEFFWSWLGNFLAKRKAKRSNATADTMGSRQDLARRSLPSQTTTHPNRSSGTSSIASRERDAQYVAREEMLEYEAARYSLWGEIVYHYKAWCLKRAKKKADAEKQRARAEKAKRQIALAPDVSPEDEDFQPSTYRTLASPTLEVHPILARQIDNMNPNALPPLTRKPLPTHTRNKSSGEVSKHTVKIVHLPPIHNSVHLSEGPWNSHNDEEEPPLPRRRYSSTVTAFGDFMRRPSEPLQMPTERLTRIPSHVPVPQERYQPEPLRPAFYQQGRSDSTWTFTVPGIDDEFVRNSGPTFSALNLPETINEGRESGGPEHQHCDLCGGLNSPNTHYGDQGVWLCSACRNPNLSTERPPSSFSVPRKEKAMGKRRQRSRLGSHENIKASKEVDKTRFNNGHCESCNTSLPPLKIFADYPIFICQGCNQQLTSTASPSPVSPLSPIFPFPQPAPLRLTKNNSTRRIRDSVDSPVSPMSIDPFANFDFDNSNSYSTGPSTPSHHRQNGSDLSLPPTPYPKDSGYISPNNSRLSFYPDTPTSTAPGVPRKDSEILPPIPTRPSSSKGKKLPHLPHAPPPVPKEDRPTRFPLRTDSLSSTPNPTHLAATTLAQFAFAPPPIPEEKMHRPKRSSSIYPDDSGRDGRGGRDARDTYMLPALQFDGKGTLRESKRSTKSKRDTGFYEFWNPILEER